MDMMGTTLETHLVTYLFLATGITIGAVCGAGKCGKLTDTSTSNIFT